MAISVSQPQRNDISGSRITAFLEVTLDNSYPTGGYALNLSDYVANPEQITIHQSQLSGDQAVLGYLFQYQDSATVADRKIMAFQKGADPPGPATYPAPAAPLAEIDNATDLSNIILSIVITGRR